LIIKSNVRNFYIVNDEYMAKVIADYADIDYKKHEELNVKTLA